MWIWFIYIDVHLSTDLTQPLFCNRKSESTEKDVLNSEWENGVPQGHKM